jgi:hypothetical protein
MKKTLTLSENQLIGVIKRIAEQVNLDDFSQSDFLDVFFQVFRSWIGEKLGDDYKKYPTSLLLKRYGQEFAQDKGLIHRGGRDQFDSSYYSLEHYGKELVRKSHYTLPSSYKDEKFTEKYKKVIPHFVEMLELPSFITVSFEEREPNRVTVKFHTNFDEWMKYPERKSIDEYNMLKKIKKIFEDFGGVDFGNPAYGEVEMNYSSTKDFSTDEWVKKQLNKVIKKAIRELDEGKNIHSIRFKPTNSGGKIELVFKDRYRFGYQEKNNLRSRAKDVVSSLGYGPNLSVDTV